MKPMKDTAKPVTGCVQISLFDLLSVKRWEEAKPCLTIGQDIFLLNLDVVRKGAVSRMWLCDKCGDAPFYGYSIDLENGSHTVTWDTEIGKGFFASEAEASVAAVKVTPTLDKMTLRETDIHDRRSFKYCRSSDQRELTATVAKVGENQIYWKDFITYHFLETYPTPAIRDKKYREYLKKMQSESGNQGGTEVVGQPLAEILYRSTDTRYASWEYSERNGSPYLKLKGV